MYLCVEVKDKSQIVIIIDTFDICHYLYRLAGFESPGILLSPVAILS